ELPSHTQCTQCLRRFLPNLPYACGAAVAAISGRRIEDVDRILAPHVYLAAAVHGLERRGADGSVASFAPNESLAHMRRKVEQFVRRHAGVWIEDKLTAFAVHYRARPELE